MFTTTPIPGIPYSTEAQKKKIKLKYLGSIENPDVTIDGNNNRRSKSSSINLMNQNLKNDDLFNLISTLQMEYGTIAQPLVSSRKIDTGKKDKNDNPIFSLETNIFIFDNYKSKILDDNLIVYQNFRRDINGKYQLGYHVCFMEPNNERGKYSLYRLTISNLDIEYIPFGVYPNTKPSNLDVNIIDEVVAFVTNTNPKTSRGTVTTVKNASGN